MKYKLDAIDRLNIPRILPQDGSMLEQAIIDDILEMVRLRSADYVKYGIKERVNPINPMEKILDSDSLDKEKNPRLLNEVECDLSKPQTQILNEAVDKLDKDKKIPRFMYPTCKKIKAMRG